MPSESTRLTLLVAQTLERLGIPYAVGGSLASSLYGVMRSTLDVDIVADMKMEHIRPLVAALSKEFKAGVFMKDYNFYVYILTNWNDEVMYIGMTNNLGKI